MVGTPSFSVEIDKACSGYQGIGLICAFLTFYLWFYRKTLRFPQATLLVPTGVIAIWLANALRIAALILIGSWFSPDVALGGFHSQAGWLAFNVVALGLVAVAGRSPFFSIAISPTAKTLNPSVPYLAPFLVGLAVAMVTGALSTGFDRLYPMRVLAVLGAIWCFRKAYTGFRWSWSWQAVGLGALTSIVWIILAPTPSEASAGGLSPSELAGMPIVLAVGWWFFRAVGYVIAVPLAEELAFRGYLMRRLISADFHVVPLGQFSWLSLVASSALFGAFHGHSWLPGCLAGVLFATALYRRGRITDAVLAHATANGLLVIHAAATGNWYLWS
jgi:exosortase E/protease (VPEID-CTERM system)